jgi:hypothetical protein
MSSVSSEIYDGLYEFGVIKANIYLGIGILVALCLIVLAIYTIYTNTDSNYLSVKGNVVNSKCTQSVVINDNKQITVHHCIVSVKYTINNKVYTSQLVSDSTSAYLNGQLIDIKVDKNKLTNIELPTINKTYMASGLFFVASLLLCGCYFNYWLTNKYKFFGAASGASTTFNLVRSTF